MQGKTKKGRWRIVSCPSSAFVDKTTPDFDKSEICVLKIGVSSFVLSDFERSSSFLKKKKQTKERDNRTSGQE